MLNPKVFDRRAAYRFSLAFQRVVNISVRDSEPIRSRVVQAGTLGVVGFILEAWLASKVFAVGSGVGQVARSGAVARECSRGESSINFCPKLTDLEFCSGGPECCHIGCGDGGLNRYVR